MCIVSWSSFIVISSILFKTCPLCTINDSSLLARFLSYYSLNLEFSLPLLLSGTPRYIIYILKNSSKSLLHIFIEVNEQPIKENEMIFILQRIVTVFNEKRTKQNNLHDSLKYRR